MADDTPNPDFKPIVSREDREAADESWLHFYHRAAGSPGTFYDLYSHRRPKDWGLTEDEKAAARARPVASEKSRDRGGNSR